MSWGLTWGNRALPSAFSTDPAGEPDRRTLPPARTAVRRTSRRVHAVGWIIDLLPPNQIRPFMRGDGAALVFASARTKREAHAPVETPDGQHCIAGGPLIGPPRPVAP